jgi:hypothetical protein
LRVCSNFPPDFSQDFLPGKIESDALDLLLAALALQVSLAPWRVHGVGEVKRRVPGEAEQYRLDPIFPAHDDYAITPEANPGAEAPCGAVRPNQCQKQGRVQSAIRHCGKAPKHPAGPGDGRLSEGHCIERATRGQDGCEVISRGMDQDTGTKIHIF